MNKRLIELSKLIDKNLTVVDVGCDHAYLPIYLIENKITDKVLAIDNKVGPLESAIKNIKKNNMENNIIPILSNGLNDINDSYDLITIAGMGGLNIIDILSSHDLKNKILVLEPNNKEKDLREFLNNNLFKIIDEKIIKDKNVYYQIIKAEYSGIKENYNELELLYGKINLLNKPKELIELLNKQKAILLKALINAKDKDSINKKINVLDEVLKGEN